MSHRPKQLGSVLQRAIQSIIERGFSDPRIQGVITVTRVKVSPDLKDAIIYVTVIPADDESLTLHGLRSAGAYIRRQAGELVAIHRRADQTRGERARRHQERR
jgi:ribosome-binding factor A